MKKMLVLAVAAAVATTVMAATKVRVVANEADKAYPGWENAYPSVAEAVAALTDNGSSANMNEILIAPGTYNITEMIQIPWYWTRIRSAKLENVEEEDPENTILDGGGTTSIMKWTGDNTYVSGLTFANGFSTNKTVDAESYAAAIKVGGHYGLISNCVFRGNASFNTAGTCINSNYRIRTVVSGCTFTNNTQTITAATGALRGCAIRINSGAPSSEANYPRIENCYFADNRVHGNQTVGSVLYATYTTIDNCTFEDNEFTPGENVTDCLGMYVYLAAGCPAIKNCRFSGRTAYPGSQYLNGSHLYVNSADCIVSNCTFSGIDEVVGDRQSGAVYVNASGVKFISCSFTNNVYHGENSLWGTALLCQSADAKNMLLRNCLFGDNTLSNRIALIQQTTMTASPVGFTLENCTLADSEVDKYNADKIITQSGSTCTNYMANCVFAARVKFDAPAIASNCCFKLPPPNWYKNPSGNITTNNCFSADTWNGFKFVDYANGDYHLQPKSPLCDKGMMLDWMTAGATDLDGNKRVHLDLPDIGCYESQYSPLGLLLLFR